MPGKIRRTATRNNTSGALRSYIHLQKKKESSDGWGNENMPAGNYETKFSVYANFRPLLRGSATGVEDVFADRLQGNQPYIITVRNCSAFKDVTIGWRIQDARDSNNNYNIMSPPSDVTDGGRWLEFIAVVDKNDG